MSCLCTGRLAFGKGGTAAGFGLSLYVLEPPAFMYIYTLVNVEIVNAEIVNVGLESC